MAKYLRKQCVDLNEAASYYYDDKDDDDDNGNSKMLRSCRSWHGWSTNNAWHVSKPEIPIKGRKKLSCRHERQIIEDKNAEQIAKPYKWLFYVRIKFVW